MTVKRDLFKPAERFKYRDNEEGNREQKKYRQQNKDILFQLNHLGDLQYSTVVYFIQRGFSWPGYNSKNRSALKFCFFAPEMTIFSDPLFIAKLLWTILLLFLTIAFCVAPFFILKKIKKGRNTKTIMGYMNSLAAGVVLGALLMHMIPELNHGHTTVDTIIINITTTDTKVKRTAIKRVTRSGPTHHDHEYPWGPLAAGFSFLILFAVDRLTMDHAHPHHGHTEKFLTNLMKTSIIP